MLEFMDSVAINAVEDHLKMGLDRSAGALLVAQSDAPGAAAATEVAIMEQAFTECGATEVFSTTDPDEGEAFTAARRFAIPAIEKIGHLLLEDVGVPLHKLPDLIDGIAAIAANRTGAHLGDRPRRRRQHPPADRARSRATPTRRPAPTRHSER